MPCRVRPAPGIVQQKIQQPLGVLVGESYASFPNPSRNRESTEPTVAAVCDRVFQANANIFLVAERTRGHRPRLQSRAFRLSEPRFSAMILPLAGSSERKELFMRVMRILAAAC